MIVSSCLIALTITFNVSLKRSCWLTSYLISIFCVNATMFFINSNDNMWAELYVFYNFKKVSIDLCLLRMGVEICKLPFNICRNECTVLFSYFCGKFY